jgi:hypothetical protein
VVLVDHAAEHLPALYRRGQRHDNHLVMADLSGAEIRFGVVTRGQSGSDVVLAAAIHTLCRDRMVEPDEFALHPPVPHARLSVATRRPDPVIEPHTIRSKVRPRLLVKPLVGRVGLEPTTGGL